MYVVAELFSETWCQYCPIARSALRTMADDSDTYPYLIPMLFQENTRPEYPPCPNPSPSYISRAVFYSGNSWSLPFCRWQGQVSEVGGGSGTLGAYISRYNYYSSLVSPIAISANFTISPEGLLTAKATVQEESNLQNMDNTHVIFALTHNFYESQIPDYVASVVRFAQQPYEGEGSYTQTFELNPAWFRDNLYLVCLVQNLGGDKQIYNGTRAQLSQYTHPTGVITFSGPSQISLSWLQGYSPIASTGWYVYRNGTRLTQDPLNERKYTDLNVEAGTDYTYTVTTLYAGDIESDPSLAFTAQLQDTDYFQFGSGSMSNPTTSPCPINVYYRSHHGQFIYTKEELNLAGIEGPDLIGSIGFYVTNTPGLNLSNFQLRLKHTTQSNTLQHIGGEWEMIVVPTSFRPIVGGWRYINIEPPFPWDGIQNIVIDTTFGLTPQYSATGTMRIVITDKENGYRYSQSDTANQANVNTNTLIDYKPQVRMTLTTLAEAPSDLQYTLGAGFVTLSWSPPSTISEHFAGYRIYKHGAILNWDLLQSTTYTDNNLTPGITYLYWVIAEYDDGRESEPTNTISVTVPTSEQDEIITPLSTKLGSNFPNPFNPSTSIYFDLHKPSDVLLEIYNIRGQLISTLADTRYSAGRHTVVWDGLDNNGQKAGSGVYLYKLQTEGYSETKKMIMVK